MQRYFALHAAILVLVLALDLRASRREPLISAPVIL